LHLVGAVRLACRACTRPGRAARPARPRVQLDEVGKSR
jgi:hypothetical protein